MNIPIIRIPFNKQEKESLQRSLSEILDSGMLSMGKYVREFEESFKDFTGSKYALAVNSGTAALEIILRAIGVEGKTVAMPSNTYMASPLAAIHAGAKPVFVDCERENLQMSVIDLKRKMRDDTAAVMLVHIGGIISPKYYEIKKFCEERGIHLVEDAAHAHGATIDGKMAGTLGHAAAFSFYATKVLTSGEGGMMVTDNENIFKKGEILREHGKKESAFNIHVDFGHTWTLSEFQAMVGVLQVKKAEEILIDRRRIAGKYDVLLKNIDGLYPLYIPKNIQSSYYKYIAFLAEDIDRDNFKKCVKKKYSVSLTGEVYAYPCHRQPVFEIHPEKIIKPDLNTFSNTEYVVKHHICLPLYPGMTDEEIEYVADSLKSALKEVA
ncbi:MAG: Glutamine-scyllo-inositol transaminase [Candidatus Gottesmanbacteria bacterium GW2011_GWC2_39_8]|uniref:Glutamine-scyllo-inositol transaminase n=1 Tax=Candidatus Gottesmanbacteria bacterium GW2011_GWC2_39_8 TaxID=1618450 RepID=A0A0G0SEU7_9BACT|nr:MAG: Glutamine-scyllo-inositol transaminase [Candidatus Gottesmanbacteria bacterium GW2011_GWC2_39_8]